jgi:chemotaxis protein methyltransferase CheR
VPPTMNETTYSDGAGLTLKTSEFRLISQLAHQRFGLDLKGGKEALVTARLGKWLRKGGFKSFDEYYRHVLADTTGDALVGLIDSLTTNHTSFLREKAHFEFLTRAASEEFKAVRTLEIWSAACSSGEEPYTIAMCLSDTLAGAGGKGRDFQILATDISTRVLGLASTKRNASRSCRTPGGKLISCVEPASVRGYSSSSRRFAAGYLSSASI